jgi:hypothetical protein
MRVIAGTRFRATESYECKKEKWLLQVAGDPELSRAALRVAVAIGIHMNRKENMRAWPGYTRIAKILGVDPKTARNGVKDLEARKHMRVVRSRRGSKNNPNSYHPNIWRTEGGATVSLGRDHVPPRVGTHISPEPLNEPTTEPLNIRKGREDFVWRGSQFEKPKHPLAKPNFRRLVPISEVMEALGIVPRGFAH